MLDLHWKHCKCNSTSIGISCGMSCGCHDLKTVICTATGRNFQVAHVQMASSCSESLIMWPKYQFTFLSLVSFKKSKDNLTFYLYLHLPLEGEFLSSPDFPVIIFQCWFKSFFCAKNEIVDYFCTCVPSWNRARGIRWHFLGGVWLWVPVGCCVLVLWYFCHCFKY